MGKDGRVVEGNRGAASDRDKPLIGGEECRTSRVQIPLLPLRNERRVVFDRLEDNVRLTAGAAYSNRYKLEQQWLR